jgi:hypothetical protein
MTERSPSGKDPMERGARGSAGGLPVSTAANIAQEVEKGEDSTTGVADLTRLCFNALEGEMTTVKNRKELVGDAEDPEGNWRLDRDELRLLSTRMAERVMGNSDVVSAVNDEHWLEGLRIELQNRRRESMAYGPGAKISLSAVGQVIRNAARELHDVLCLPTGANNTTKHGHGVDRDRYHNQSTTAEIQYVDTKYVQNKLKVTPKTTQESSTISDTPNDQLCFETLQFAMISIVSTNMIDLEPPGDPEGEYRLYEEELRFLSSRMAQQMKGKKNMNAAVLEKNWMEKQRAELHEMRKTNKAYGANPQLTLSAVEAVVLKASDILQIQRDRKELVRLEEKLERLEGEMKDKTVPAQRRANAHLNTEIGKLSTDKNKLLEEAALLKRHLATQQKAVDHHKESCTILARVVKVFGVSPPKTWHISEDTMFNAAMVEYLPERPYSADVFYTPEELNLQTMKDGETRKSLSEKTFNAENKTISDDLDDDSSHSDHVVYS